MSLPMFGTWTMVKSVFTVPNSSFKKPFAKQVKLISVRRSLVRELTLEKKEIASDSFP